MSYFRALSAAAEKFSATQRLLPPQSILVWRDQSQRFGLGFPMTQTVKAHMNSVQFIFLIAPIRLSNTACRNLPDAWAQRSGDDWDAFATGRRTARDQ